MAIKQSILILLITTCILHIETTSCAQQKGQYTQYQFDGILLNPAYAGLNEALTLAMISRYQWSGVQGAPNTQTFYAHTPFRSKQIGLGFALSNDKIGIHSNLGLSTSYAYHLNLGKDHLLSFGLQVGLYNRKTDYSTLLEDAGNDPSLYNASISHTFFDFGAGLYYRHKKLEVGFSIPELLPEKLNLNDSLTVIMNQINNFLLIKYAVPLSASVELQPGILFKYLKGVPLSYDINVNMLYRGVLSAGLSYRKSESLDFLLMLKVLPQLRIGYSYDHYIGRANATGSHEVAVQYIFKFTKTNIDSPR